MAKVIGLHKVKDYNRWKPFYDADEPRRSAAGIKTISILRGKIDPNMIFMHWELDNPEILDKMLYDPVIRNIMQEAGVLGQVEYFILD